MNNNIAVGYYAPYGSNGSTNTGLGVKALLDARLWCDILDNAERTPALKIALQNLINLHNLTKDHGSET